MIFFNDDDDEQIFHHGHKKNIFFEILEICTLPVYSRFGESVSRTQVPFTMISSINFFPKFDENILRISGTFAKIRPFFSVLSNL